MELTTAFDLAFFALAGGVLGYLVFKWPQHYRDARVIAIWYAWVISFAGVFFLGMSVAYMNPLAHMWVSRAAIVGVIFFITFLICIVIDNN